MQVGNRLKLLRSHMERESISSIIVMNPDHQYYLSGFKALLYSRPIVLYIDFNKASIIVPGLEEAHARHEAIVDEIEVYYEHPNASNSKLNHFEYIEDLISENENGSTVGVDLSSTPGEIVQFAQKFGCKIADIGQKIVEMRYIKDSYEIDLLEKSGELVNLAVSESLKSCKEGITEMEMDAVGNSALFAATASQYPQATLDMFVMSPSGVKRSNMPHVFSNTRKLRTGDVMIHSRQVGLNGYRAELERTVIIGGPTEEQKKAFESARIAQQKALDFIKPGVKAYEVDKIAREVFEKDGYGEYAIHRTGHGIGISAHEKPYLRYDNDLILEEGMVFSVEPGIYVPGLGGFRHSDTVVLTSDGSRLITEYPRDLASLIF
ncbi:peptidase M24 [Lentibacillus populi]|uniref:Peptidase M24 n=1 Tax=Lentibacillus populi TaxID=1827502 RepID=A0A9W5TY66_9BACI|nr:Xaa-Pro peptidase family protein [Lentibacillus populi]GGB45790.1 peptidase M24 [Lentibacillus populi]